MGSEMCIRDSTIVMGLELTDQQRAGLEGRGLIIDGTDTEHNIALAPNGWVRGVNEFSASVGKISITEAGGHTSAFLDAAAQFAASEAADDIRAARHPLFIGIPFPWN